MLDKILCYVGKLIIVAIVCFAGWIVILASQLGIYIYNHFCGFSQYENIFLYAMYSIVICSVIFWTYFILEPIEEYSQTDDKLEG